MCGKVWKNTLAVKNLTLLFSPAISLSNCTSASEHGQIMWLSHFGLAAPYTSRRSMPSPLASVLTILARTLPTKRTTSLSCLRPCRQELTTSAKTPTVTRWQTEGHQQATRYFNVPFKLATRRQWTIREKVSRLPNKSDEDSLACMCHFGNSSICCVCLHAISAWRKAFIAFWPKMVWSLGDFTSLCNLTLFPCWALIQPNRSIFPKSPTLCNLLSFLAAPAEEKKKDFRGVPSLPEKKKCTTTSHVHVPLTIYITTSLGYLTPVGSLT